MGELLWSVTRMRENKAKSSLRIKKGSAPRSIRAFCTLWAAPRPSAWTRRASLFSPRIHAWLTDLATLQGIDDLILLAYALLQDHPFSPYFSLISTIAGWRTFRWLLE